MVTDCEILFNGKQKINSKKIQKLKIPKFISPFEYSASIFIFHKYYSELASSAIIVRPTDKSDQSTKLHNYFS